jgi:hypothetical protein
VSAYVYVALKLYVFDACCFVLFVGCSFCHLISTRNNVRGVAIIQQRCNIMLSLEVSTSVLDVLTNNSTIGIRKIFRLLENRNHHHDHIHHEKHPSSQGPLADYLYCESPDDIGIDDNDHNDCRPNLNMKSKKMVEMLQKERGGGGLVRKKGDSRRLNRNRNRGLEQNNIYFQQLGKYYNDTAPPPSSSSSRCTNQHHRTRMTGKTKSLKASKAKPGLVANKIKTLY